MGSDFNMPAVIRAKRDGATLDTATIQELIRLYGQGRIPDYQMSAWAMAVFFRGMAPEETVALTQAMRDSGQRLDLSALPGPKIDKHSTGGVGDKVSICLTPLVAACGVTVPMMCGRGLGHTGGTVDKLEAIPGMRTELSPEAVVAQLERIACVMVGQSEAFVPADRALYALRDVTSTVESVPLITASILSKKAAEGIEGLVLDVKVGAGAFMKTEADAERLAQTLCEVGEGLGLRVRALLNPMDAPLGRTIGNALEVIEAIEVLQGRGPADLVSCTENLGAAMLELGGIVSSIDDGVRAIRRAIRDGSGLERFAAMVRMQGGDERCVHDPSLLPKAPHRRPLSAPRDGYLVWQDAFALGELARALGAGRMRQGELIDPRVGITLMAKPGDAIMKDQPLLVLHGADAEALEAASAAALAAHRIADTPAA